MLAGCTASGKSEIALEVARAMAGGEFGPPVEIVTADSMQVYVGMDIGTAKPNRAEREEIPHHLVDVVDPTEDWDVSRFAAEVEKVIADIEARGRRALLVGGSGLYVQAVVDGFAPPGRWPEIASDLEAQSEDLAALYSRLVALDPEGARKIEPGNKRRILRALEVTLGSGRPFSSWGPGMQAWPSTSWKLAGVWLPRERVRQRIETRFDKMLEAGLLEEVDALLALSAPLSKTAAQALGYRELIAHRRHGTSLGEAVTEAVSRTKAFARRQRVWWRRDPRIIWIGSATEPRAVIPHLLEHWRQ